MNSPSFSKKILNLGFVLSIALSGVSFLCAAYYMFNFQTSTMGFMEKAIASAQDASTSDRIIIQNALAVHFYASRIALVSCGIFSGLSFGFLGFSLFLIGASNTSDVSMSGGDNYQVALKNIAPGTVSIICGAAIIGLCATKDLPANMTLGSQPVLERTIQPDITIAPDPQLPKEIEGDQ